MHAGSAADAPPGDEPRNRRLLALALVAAYMTGLWLRLLELPQWDNPLLMVDGNPILATHDAYAWLGGAKGIGTGAGSAMAALARMAASLTGCSLDQAAFWIPALAGPLVGVAAGLWAWTLGGGAAAAMSTGMLASIAPGFFNRTRLGYYDTDIATLLLPLIQTWLVARWLGPWLRRPGHDAPDTPPGEPGALAPLLAGLTMRYGGAQWHPALAHFTVWTVLCAVLLAALLARPGARTRLLGGLAVCGLAAMGDAPGLAAALALATALALGLERLLPQRAGLAATALVLVLGLGLMAPPLHTAMNKAVHIASSYTVTRVDQRLDHDPARETGTAQYPGVIQSVIEAKGSGLNTAMGLVAAWPLAGWAGLAGFALVAALRPTALLIAPLAALAFLAGNLGIRLTMFAGPEAALGLALPLHWALARSLRRAALPAALRRTAPLAAQAALATLLILPLYQDYAQKRPGPIISKQQVVALKSLAHTAPPDAAVWTWWDWGYAAQYFTGLPSFADGARHSGEYLYPLALTLTTPVPLQARQMMQYTALKDYKPWEIFDKRPAEEVRTFIASLVSEHYDLNQAPPQYLVVTWESLRLVHWIVFYGSWDVTTGQGVHGQILRLRNFDLDPEAGSLKLEDGRSFQLASLDVLEKTTRSSKTWQRSGPHMIVHNYIKKAVLLDDLTYNSMLLRLLICPADDPEIAPHFSLAYEGYPLVRIWRTNND